MESKDNNSTSNLEEQIELRSNNTRQFIREEPPFIIRHGTSIIVIILILAAIVLYLTVI